MRNLIQVELQLMLFEDRLSIDQLQSQLVQEDGTGILLEDSDLVLKNYNYVMLESFQFINLATQTGIMLIMLYEADAGFGTASLMMIY